MNFEAIEAMYALLWEFIYNLAKYFGWEIENPYADAEDAE